MTDIGDEYTQKSVGALAAALAKAQAEIQHAKEDATNPHFKSKYATLASIWNACRAQLSKNGLAIVQKVSGAGDNKATVTTKLIHVSGEFEESSLTVQAMDAKPQSLGSAITYARRYGLAAMVGVAPSEDDDAEIAQRGTTRAKPRAGFDPGNKEHADELIAQLKKRGVNEDLWDNIAVRLKGRSSSDLEQIIREATQ